MFYPGRRGSYKSNANPGSNHDEDGNGEYAGEEQLLGPLDPYMPEHPQWDRHDEQVCDDVGRQVAVKGAKLVLNVASSSTMRYQTMSKAGTLNDSDQG